MQSDLEGAAQRAMAPTDGTRATWSARPADGLLHPVALITLVVLIANDHALKQLSPGLVTGKLSDLAGLLVAPLALVAAWEVAEWAVGRWDGPSRRALAVAILVVGVGFGAVQVWPLATDAYRWALGAAQWPVRALEAALSGMPAGGITPVAVVADAADLLALPALAVTWWVGTRRRRPRESRR